MVMLFARISVVGFLKRAVSLIEFSPVAFLLLLIFLFCGLDLTWEWGITADSYPMTSHIGIGMMILVMIIFLLMSLRKWTSKAWRNVGGVISLLLVGFLSRDSISFEPNKSEWIGLFVIAAISVLSLVVIPYFKQKHTDRAIHEWLLYCLYQGMLAFIFTVILAGGISLALLAIEALFSVSIDGNRFGTVRIVIGCLFGFVSFLDALVQGDIMNEGTDKHEKWKSMLAWVLSILLLVFGVILYVYMIKIVVTWNWPSNEVTFWAYLFAGLIIVASLLILPLLSWSEDKMYEVRRSLYLSLLPICVMIGIAIRLRIDQYGITEARYFAVVCCIWLIGNALMMIFVKRASVYTLFWSLFIIGVIAVFGGPISASGIAYSSQRLALEKELFTIGLCSSSGIGTDLVTGNGGLTSDQKSMIAGYLDFFANDQGRKSIAVCGATNAIDDLYLLFGVDPSDFDRYGFGPYGPNGMLWKGLSLEQGTSLPIAGYDSLFTDIYLDSYSTDAMSLGEGSGTTIKLSGGNVLLDYGGVIENYDISGLFEIDGGTDQIFDINQGSFVGEWSQIIVKFVSLKKESTSWLVESIQVVVMMKDIPVELGGGN